MVDVTVIPGTGQERPDAKPMPQIQGNVLFDAPPRRYKLKLADETGDRAALVDIPLNFGSETPDIPTPGADAKEKK